MSWSSARRAASAVVAALVIAAASVGSLSAQQPPRLTPGAFLANPDQLLGNYHNGGAGMSEEIADLVIADHTTLDKILQLLPKENRYQRIATGRGLARAALYLIKNGDQAFATQIQDLIDKTKDQDVILAYLIGKAERELGTIGGGGGGTGGGSGGQTNSLGQQTGSNGGGTTPASTSTSTSTASNTSGGTSGGGGGGNGVTQLSNSNSP